jgi:hypothetical protein
MESTIPQAAENASRAKFLHPPVESALSRRSARHDPPVADSPDVIASTTDQDGLAVVLLSRIWNQKILRDHPEMHAHLDAVPSRCTSPSTSPPIQEIPACATTAATSDPVAGCLWS